MPTVLAIDCQNYDGYNESQAGLEPTGAGDEHDRLKYGVYYWYIATIFRSYQRL